MSEAFTMIPNTFFDVWMPRLTKAELRVLLYLMRRTYGFQRDSVEIGVRLIAHGIPGKDSGTGLQTEAVTAAINGLTGYGLLRFTEGVRGRRTYSVDCTAKQDTQQPDRTGKPDSDRTGKPYTNKEREIKVERKRVRAPRISPTERRGTRFSLDTLPAEWHEFAKAESGWDDGWINREFLKFSDHHSGKSGPKALMVDWLKAWRNWIRNAVDWQSPTANRKPIPAQTPTLSRYIAQ